MKSREQFKLPETLEKGLDAVDRLLAPGNVDLNLDFADVTFISVDRLEWLEELLLRAKSYGAIVGFSNVRPEQYKVFKVVKIDSILEACGALAQSGPAC